MRILIVDDDLANCKLIQHIIIPYGESEWVTNGEAAWESFKTAHQQQIPFEIIFLDIMMPEMDGHQVLQNIRKWEEDHLPYGRGEAKIVMVSALDTTDHVLSSFKEGCEFYLIKPISSSKVRNIMTKMGY